MARWPFVKTIVVPWGDLDAAGHVNNARYFGYFETARTDWYLEARGADRWEDLDIILASTRCDYRSAARFHDALAIEVRPGKIGATSFELLYTVRAADGRLVAEGQSVQVCYDYAAEAKKPIPPGIRAALESP